ncbi:hypothetical protein LRQ11_01710 [Pseudomonas sp. MAFF 311095]|uniref:RING-type E3 ubiquitin transferase n=1 Tax=Pseudomonas petroselini TaxID=2899822 RepID=A0ABS8QTI4_9PSED|nr:NEL-type E3 ubiquitin ligase domain-containing protein [Pseudomonas petroselini]MCD7038353.1 hypothetical protein [Pseudomonas petroselini]MCD7047172.1 hypothetical protein [Pseudomonas petroselini]MCD7077703.1 hypothetical protein [Pseudomonas petroselini]
MPTHQLLNGLSGNLQSSTAWARQQSLELIQHTVAQAMQGLTPPEQTRYLQLQREALAAVNAVEAEKNRLIQAFKVEGLAELREKIGGRDPENYRLYTTYLEKREQPFPWEPRVTEPPYRPRRALDEWQYIEHTKSMTLWEAACLNFGFTSSIIQASGYSLAEASEIIGGNDDRSLPVKDFIAVARKLNLGGRLRALINPTLSSDGTLRNLIKASSKALLLFDLLDAWRNRAVTGLTRPMYDTLHAALNGDGPQPPFDMLSLTSSRTPILPKPHTAWHTAMPIPLLLINVASLGVLSYFPFRPGGALRYHVDAQAAENAWREQLNASHQQQDLGWFSRQLPLIGLATFKSLLRQEPRPKDMNWLTGLLYDGFHKAFPQRTLDSVRFSTAMRPDRPLTLVEAFTHQQIQRFQADLDTLATPRSEADWQALTDAVAAIAGEVLQLLLTPLPGGVTGLNRMMQLAVMGSLTYSVGQGLSEAIQGDASGFASAMADVADLAVSGRLISTAGRLHRQRMLDYLNRLGNPRKVTRPDGVEALWKPDAQPYAVANQALLNGKTADALGVFSVKGKRYVKLRHDDQALVVEVRHDSQSMRYVLKHANADTYNPPIIFEPAWQAWKFDLHNAHTLSDINLLQRMLPNGSSHAPVADLEHMLKSTATPRATLDRVWAGHSAPLNLIEGVRRLQADRVIQQIIDHFDQPGYMPPHGDSTVFCLLTQLAGWPVDALLSIREEAGEVIEIYSKPEHAPTKPHLISLTRREDGSYLATDGQRVSPGSADTLLLLILQLQPSGSTLGQETRHNRSPDQRVVAIREQVVALARQARMTLFSAVVDFSGYEKGERLPPADVRRFLPFRASPPLVAVTPLLKKMRDLNRPLSPAHLEQLLTANPLTPRQHQAFLDAGTLPTAFAEWLDHHRTALRIDAAIDGLYHPRAHNDDIDQWAREFASALVRNTLKRPFVITEVVAGDIATPYLSSGSDDPTVELRHYGRGRYEAYDLRNGGTIPVAPDNESFYLAIGSVLHPHERQLLGMNSASDSQGLRNTLGDYMSNQRNTEGFVSLVNGSLVQYEQRLDLPPDLAPTANGIFVLDGRHYLPLLDALYRIAFDKKRLKWRLHHPTKIGVDTPTLEHNGEGTWRLSSENPMTWDDHRLLYRLGNHAYAFTRDMAARILALTDTSAPLLRQVHRNGRAVPPLLADTCKRLKIEQEIHRFIEAMRAEPTSRSAQPHLQMLVISSLPDWPSSHVLQIVDRQNRVLQQYPVSQAPDAQAVKVTEHDYKDAKLLEVLSQNDAITQGLLGELPASHDERLFKLVKKIVEFAQREKADIFNSLYAQSETTGNLRDKHFKAKFPELPTPLVKAILEHASPRELRQLRDKHQVSLRLAEQVRLSSHDLRLNRAYEGLYLSAWTHPDSDKITLHLLKSLPTWPKGLRIDIHEGDSRGRLLESAGHLDGSVRRVLARTQRGYQGYAADGAHLGAPSPALLDVIVKTLSDSEKAALGVVGEPGIADLREQIAALALERRVEIKRLLDLPHVQPWMVPPLGVNRTFLAYPLWSGLWPFGGNRPPDLMSRVQQVYPRFSNDDARRFIRSLNLSEPAALIELDRRQAEIQALPTELQRWSDATYSQDDNLESDSDSDSDRQSWSNLTTRRALALRLCEAARRENPQRFIFGLFHLSSLTLQLDTINTLPTLSIDSRTFEHIEYLHLAGDTFPVQGDAFLRHFSQLRALKIDCDLNELPSAISDMAHLTHLDLADNRIVLTATSAERLSRLVNLRELNVSDNPLGVVPDFAALTELQTLNLRNTGLTQWPHSAWALPNLSLLHLEENHITTLPESLFSSPQALERQRRTLLHDNPLTLETRQRLARYSAETRVNLRGARPGIVHLPGPSKDFNHWLSGVHANKHESLRFLWDALREHEGASPDDTFRVLRDLTQSYDYRQGGRIRAGLTQRVWTLLIAMGNSNHLCETIFLNTYAAGTCGDGAILTFSNMELMHRAHQAKSQQGSHQVDKDLLVLAQGSYLIEQLDQFSEDLIARLETPEEPLDAAEVTLFFRVRLTEEFSLPVHPEQMLYAIDERVTEQHVQEARDHLNALRSTPALQDSILEREFWIEYLALSYPEPFLTVRDASKLKQQELDQQVQNKRSDEYLERRQSLIEREKLEQYRLVRQLTEAAQLAQRVH